MDGARLVKRVKRKVKKVKIDGPGAESDQGAGPGGSETDSLDLLERFARGDFPDEEDEDYNELFEKSLQSLLSDDDEGTAKTVEQRETILRDGAPAGYLTSAGFGHTIGKPIGYSHVSTHGRVGF